MRDLGDLGDLESSLGVSGVGIWGISGLRQIPYLGSVRDLWRFSGVLKFGVGRFCFDPRG